MPTATQTRRKIEDLTLEEISKLDGRGLADLDIGDGFFDFSNIDFGSSLETQYGLELACQTDFVCYMRYVWDEVFDFPFIEASHIKHIQTFFMELFMGISKRSVLNCPPRHLKSVMMSFFIAWTYGLNPACNYIHITHSDELALENSARVKKILRTKKHAKIFGKFKFSREKNARNIWKSQAGGVFFAAGSGKPVTGWGAGIAGKEYGGMIIVDDPDDPYKVRSKAFRKRIQKFIDEVLGSRVNSIEYTPIAFIQQRVRIDDVSDFLRKKGKGIWKFTVLKAIKDDGTPLFPENFTIEELEAIKRNSYYTFMAQYQQTPFMEGGGVFKEDYIQYYKYTREMQFDFRVITVDCASKTEDRHDFSVFQCWGMRDRKAYLIDELRGKWEAQNLNKMGLLFWDKHNRIDQGTLRYMGVEDKVAGTSLIQFLQKKVPIKPIQRSKDKFQRAQNVAAFWGSRMVYLPKFEWALDVAAEVISFTGDKENREVDDRVDTLIDGIEHTIGSMAIREACV